MQLIKKLTALSLLASASGVALAEGPTAELKVTGRILPPGCTIATAAGGVVDYGTIARGSLSLTADTPLARKNLVDGITVTCDSPTAIGLTFINNRTSSDGGNTAATPTAEGAHSAGAGTGAGLGFDASGNKIGGYAASIGHPRVDGANRHFAARENGFMKNYWGAVTRGAAGPNSYAFVDDNGNAAIGQVFVATYSVAASIAPTSTLDMSKEILLDGSMTVQVDYL